jgi:hypothetical protein
MVEKGETLSAALMEEWDHIAVYARPKSESPFV